ncbi:MAG: tetrahydromethanopterin S-methyltransferase subunit H, partial [Methanosphaera sp.]|nr:tetrahydromethanopterin S-methyltransferase subunit H [Methanosphaera sp.]
WIKKYKKEYPEVWPVCDVGANIVQQMAGGDFVLFGPIENTRKAFTACAMTDMFIAEANEAIGINPIDSHPYKNLL